MKVDEFIEKNKHKLRWMCREAVRVVLPLRKKYDFDVKKDFFDEVNINISYSINKLLSIQRRNKR